MAGQNSNDVALMVEISAGELVDKITILEIKSERISDTAKLQNVRTELAALSSVRDAGLPRNDELNTLTAQLREINEMLWDIEDEIRRCEASQQFDEPFVRLARSVYYTNDERARLKRAINTHVGSHFVEEKEYLQYDQPAE